IGSSSSSRTRNQSRKLNPLAMINKSPPFLQGASMPLLDHFRPPLSQQRHWDSFHGAWAEAIAGNLNQTLLPERFVAEARVKLGGKVKIDIAKIAETGTATYAGSGGVAVWAPSKPIATAPLAFQTPDLFEVQIVTEEGGPRP